MEIKEQDIEKELKKDFYDPLYLSRFRIKDSPTKISAIIPTYNRCPFNKKDRQYKYNPLYLCIKTLLLQKAKLQEIIVVDDASTDNTEEVIKDLKKEAYGSKGIEIIYMKNKKRRGSSISRNLGAKQAKGKYLFFLDDDCIAAPYLTFTVEKTIKEIEKLDKNFSTMVLPAYNRRTYPNKTEEVDLLSSTFFKDNGKVNLKAFPLEYLKLKDKFLNKSLKILKPIKVYQTFGHFVIERKKYLDVGGFPEFATWPNKAGEEQEFACRLIENGYSLYYLPDPKAASYHGVFGARIGRFDGKDWLAEITNRELSLEKFSIICDNGNLSGNRVNVEDYCYSKIISIFCITYKRNMKEAINWAKKSYQEFVEEAKKSWFILYPGGIIKSRRKREEIWHRAIEDGLSLLIQTEEEKINKLSKFVSSLKTKGRLEFEEREKRENKLREIFKIIYKE
jgi:glycosyltransferase involved in cell wall biosynthesis